MKKFIIYFLLIAIGGCISGKESTSNPNDAGERVLQEILKGTEVYNDTTTGSKITLTYKGYNPTKEIFPKLGNKNSWHFLYLFTWDNKLPQITNNFKAIILNTDTGKTLYSFKSSKDKTLRLESTLPESFANEDFVLLKYKAKQIEFLKGLQNRFSSAEIGNDYFIYEVDLLKGESKVTVLSSVSIFANEFGEKNGS